MNQSVKTDHFGYPKGSKGLPSNQAKSASKNLSKFSNVKSKKGLVSDNQTSAKDPKLIKTPASFAKTILSASQSKITNSKSSEGKITLHKQQVNSSTVNLVGKPLVIKQSKQLLHAGKNLVSGNILKEELKLPLNLNTVLKSSVSRDSGRENQQKKDGNHGAKNAKFLSVDIEKSEILSHSDFDQRVMTSDSSVAKIVKFVGNAILPRIAYLNKFSKKILRFALDLPNGEKLGVRLEKSGQSVSLCFIAPKSGLRDLFNFCKDGITSHLKSSQNTDISIHVFSDYSEMDNHFSKVA